MRTRRDRFSAALLLVLAACAPPLDWRDSRPEGSGVAMLFPCRPDRHERPVRIGKATLRMQMHSCEAAGATFSLAFVDAPQPDQVVPLLAELRSHAAANIAGVVAEPRPFEPPGATPNEQSGLLRIEGHLPDGRRVVEHAAFFVKGLRLYQATAIGAALPAEAVETFFGAIKVAP
ncbi:MAG: hypothetical protein ACXWCV_08585 [Caldimonas sp.]